MSKLIKLSAVAVALAVVSTTSFAATPTAAQLSQEISQLQERLSASYEDIGQGLNKYFDVN